jgi:hypothetical protein
MKTLKIAAILIGSILAAGLLLFWSGILPASAAPEAQLTPFPTPTPGPDGRIIYIVKEGDTLWRISAISDIPVEDLRDLNNLDPDDVVIPGQRIFLGLAGPAGEGDTTQVPVETATPLLPTETPEPGFGSLCVILFEDTNGDSMRQEEEPSLPGGAINISNQAGSVSITHETQEGFDYYCAEDLEEGSYNISAGIPEGYNPTTALTSSVELQAGDQSYLTFGAQVGSETAEENVPLTEESGRSPLLGVIGGILLLGGIGLGVYAVWFRR